MKNDLTFTSLISSIRQINDELVAQASRAVNVSFTLRNWLIGCYIAEYELRGVDRAEYGDRLFSELANELGRLKVSNCNQRQLYDYLKFYRVYPQIVGTVSAQFQTLLPQGFALTGEKVPTASAQLIYPPEKLVSRLSYSMFKQLMDIDDDTKRTFYEIECIRGNWSVRELNRQINSLYYERSGLSKNKKKLAELVRNSAEVAEPNLAIRDPYSNAMFWWN